MGFCIIFAGMIRTLQLTYSYSGGSQTLRFPDLSCGRGEHWLLLGQSGAGKTTFLHLLGGLLSPLSGDVVINDTHLATLKASALDHFRGKHIGIVFQKSHFVKSLTVEENLLLAQHLAGHAIDKSRAMTLLERLNLSHKRAALPERLSAGEQQRAAIARALINKPVLILADEPTSALDDSHCNEVIHLLEEEATDAGATLLVVTHDGRLKTRFEKQVLL